MKAIVSKPETNLHEWLKSLPDFAELMDCLRPASTTRSPALQKAPTTLQNLVANLSRLRGVSGRLTAHQQQGQTVYLLTTKFVRVLYDQKGDLLCASEAINEAEIKIAKCADEQFPKQRGRLLWKETRKS